MIHKIKGQDQDYVVATGTTMYITDKAVKFDLDDTVGYESTWIPKSQLEDWPRTGNHGDVVMTEWIAKQKGLM
jgi:hypothetical protein